MDSYNQLNEVLVHLFNHTMKIEEQSLIREEFKDISMNDMHIMDAIGIDQPKNMSSIARLVGVTVGTLTIAMNNLVKKGMLPGPEAKKTGGWFLYRWMRRERKLIGVMRSSIWK